MNTDWQVITPHFVCLVVVNPKGRIVYTAAYLERTWLRRPWRMLHAALQKEWGSAYRAVKLEEPLCPT
jgi:hypothetical protein